MSSDKDFEIIRPDGRIPTSPFEIQITKETLQRHIDAGEITRDDIEILRRSYRWMTISSLLGATTGVPVFFALKRRVPPVHFSLRVFAAGLMAMTGSFLGFTLGGFAGAMEVNAKMPDATRKLKVFQQIAIDSKRAIAEHRAGIPPSSDAWTPADERPRADDNVAVDASAPPAGSVASDARVQSSWDRLRQGAGSAPRVPQPRGEAGSASGAEDSASELERQQREFDAMLERERKGGEELDRMDKWK